MPRTINIVVIALLSQCGCKEKYVSPYVSPPTGYLVVEGYISGNSPTTYTITRTIPLPGDTTIPPELGAQVQVQGSDNSVYALTEQGNGVYSDSFPLDPQARYRLHIHTKNGEEYFSDYVPFKTTPPIDSVNWVNTPNGLFIYVNTHDPANATRYYLWNYDYVFEYHSGEESDYIYDRTTHPVSVRPRTAAEQVFRCWTSGSSTNILVGSSTKLASDVISMYPIDSFPPNSPELSVLYTTLVRQYALTDSGYNFYALMQKNTESLGSIFDAQPSQITGNIHCTTYPDEPVIGWVSAGTVQQQRIWINRADAPSTFSYACTDPDAEIPNIPDTLIYRFAEDLFQPLRPDIFGGVIVGWVINYSSCTECTVHGGVNYGPSWWPD